MKLNVLGWLCLSIAAGLFCLAACDSGTALKTHPDPEKRIQAMQEAIDAMEANKPNTATAPAKE